MICTCLQNQEELTFLSLRNAVLQNQALKLGKVFFEGEGWGQEILLYLSFNF